MRILRECCASGAKERASFGSRKWVVSGPDEGSGQEETRSGCDGDGLEFQGCVWYFGVDDETWVTGLGGWWEEGSWIHILAWVVCFVRSFGKRWRLMRAKCLSHSACPQTCNLSSQCDWTANLVPPHVHISHIIFSRLFEFRSLVQTPFPFNPPLVPMSSYTPTLLNAKIIRHLDLVWL